MPSTHALPAPSAREHRAYRLADWVVNAAFAALGALARAHRRLSEERARARLIAETRHLDERLLRDIGLWDKVR